MNVRIFLKSAGIKILIINKGVYTMSTNNKFDVKNTRNLTMLVDFYELTMGNGYLKSKQENTIAYFDMFFRKVPDDGGYCIMAGVQQLIEYLSNLTFTK